MDKRIGAQGYTIRDFIKTAEDLEASLKKLKDIGYQTIQLSGLGPIDPQAVRNLLKKYDIEPICTHRAPDEYLNRLEETIALHQTIGCRIAGLGSMPGDYAKTSEGIRQFIKDFTPVYEAFKKEDMTFAYHNHAFEFLKVEGRFLMDILIEESDFDFIVDCYWLAYAGIDPARFIRKMGSRAKVVHFKDLKCAFDGTFKCQPAITEVMEGNLDWDSIIEACEEAGVEAAMVEQDICPGDPFDSLRISYNNLKTKGFC
ncbi:MAG: sugar phosphate isomerase/epimerase [Clostridia bacterium]|nr:sugar phosphate isomerase/epimerase [Clostridia bacterium]